jgi:hypothetical protein
LYAAIGTSWGDGNGISGSFNLPDLRGMFLRGRDGTANNDPDKANRTAINGGSTGNNVGSKQEDGIQGHRFLTGINTPSNQGTWGSNNTYTTTTALVVTGASQATVYPAITSAAVTDGTNGTPRISSETRPKNVYVNYIIKF